LRNRRWLSKNATDRLNAHANRTGAEFVDCRDVSEDQLPHVPRLVICINSLPKLAAFGRALPAYDPAVINEVEQVLGSLTGDTFHGAEAVNALLSTGKKPIVKGATKSLYPASRPIHLYNVRGLQGDN
jgi:hypothetical protein